MVKQRRSFTPEFKARVVLELLRGEKSIAQLCREHQVKDTVIRRWQEEFVKRAPELFESGRSRSASDEARIAELERAVGRLSLELEAAKKVSN